LVQLCAESARALGFEPVIRFDGPIDSAIDDTLANELFAVVREGLTNVAKHARANSAQVAVEARAGALSVRIADDGTNFTGVAGVGRGIDNLNTRATRRGGTSSINRVGSTTEMRWQVPLPIGETNGS
jgi:signal transduction histidine kinase